MKPQLALPSRSFLALPVPQLALIGPLLVQAGPMLAQVEGQLLKQILCLELVYGSQVRLEAAQDSLQNKSLGK